MVGQNTPSMGDAYVCALDLASDLFYLLTH